MRADVARSLVRLCIVSAIALLARRSPCLAHDDPNAPVPSLKALKADVPIVVDGVPDEPFWQDAEVGTDFIDTHSGRPAAQQTLVRVAYSRTHLHIAVEFLTNQRIALGVAALGVVRGRTTHEDAIRITHDASRAVIPTRWWRGACWRCRRRHG
ncbi:MAG TPA: hypothetical protein PLU87_06010 [Sedimentisphaerales bacterium]|nr:hypothetical protein [Sedimentisphaerales bacterium]HRS10358.1 hypothetical protein [Sedimentisphaerales bacterium]HRV47063.1 hypothetical protein [Sedimentisphaerales bacterium]